MSTLVELTNEKGQSCTAFLCIENGQVTGAFTHRQLAQYISRRAVEFEGMIDLNDHTVGDILRDPSVNDGCRSLSAKLSFFDAVKVLKEPKNRVVVAVDLDTEMSLGVILRAHRRY